MVGGTRDAKEGSLRCPTTVWARVSPTIDSDAGRGCLSSPAIRESAYYIIVYTRVVRRLLHTDKRDYWVVSTVVSVDDNWTRPLNTKLPSAPLLAVQNNNNNKRERRRRRRRTYIRRRRQFVTRTTHAHTLCGKTREACAGRRYYNILYEHIKSQQRGPGESHRVPRVKCKLRAFAGHV